MSRPTFYHANQPSESQRETCRQGHILQETRFGEVPGKIGWVSPNCLVVLPAPEVDIGHPSFDVGACGEEVPASARDRLRRIDRPVFVGQIQRPDLDCETDRVLVRNNGQSRPKNLSSTLSKKDYCLPSHLEQKFRRTGPLN